MRSADVAILKGIRHPGGRFARWNKIVQAQLAGDWGYLMDVVRSAAPGSSSGPPPLAPGFFLPEGLDPGQFRRRPVVVADNVHTWASEQEIAWDDFHCLTPPWPAAWIEYPSRSGRQRRGVWIVDASYMLDYDLSKLPEGPFTDILVGCLADTKNAADGEGIVDVKFLLGLQVYVETQGQILGPVGYMLFALDERGRPIGNRWMVTDESEHVGSDNLLAMANTALWTIALCHTRNTTVEESNVPERQARAFKRRHGRPPVRYHVLKVAVPRRSGRRADRGERLAPHALHPVTGHFQHNGDCCPGVHPPKGKLFGKYEGVYFVPFHLRGEKDRGVIETDYEPVVDR